MRISLAKLQETWLRPIIVYDEIIAPQKAACTLLQERAAK
jgi:hypothetical protein